MAFETMGVEKWTLVEVYEYYDGPRLFCAQSPSDQLYLVFWTNTDDGEDDDVSWDEWLYIPVSLPRLMSVRTGETTLRDAVERCEETWALKVTTMPDRPAEVLFIAAQNIVEEEKPAVDARIFVHTAFPVKYTAARVDDAAKVATAFPVS